MGCTDSKAHKLDYVENVAAAGHAGSRSHSGGVPPTADHGLGANKEVVAAGHVGLHGSSGRMLSKSDADTQSTTCSFSFRQSVPEVSPASTPVVTSPAGSRRGSKSHASRLVKAGSRVVLERYVVDDYSEKSLLGEGTSSVCYLGVDMETGEQVAVKEYKKSLKSAAAVTKFKRQVAVLLELQKPFEHPIDDTLWSEELAVVEPSDLFVKLLDFSKDETGEPGQHPLDGSMYVVTELADLTMKSLLKQKFERKETLPAEQVRKFAKEIVLAVAGLHCKGFVHLDLKPENVMRCGGRWKLIDMDGCVRAGETIRQHDSSVSFSPCYCAPEFARFIVKEGSIVAKPSLDAWSVGMTIAELINLCPIMRSHYQQISAGHSHRAGTTHVLKWLSNLAAVPLPRRVLSAEPGFLNLVRDQLLVSSQSRRSTLAECLSASYFLA